MGILIDTVRIKNFRSLRNVEIKLSPLTLLVGANNSGKTSFLKAMQLAIGDDRRHIGKEDFFIGKDDPENGSKEILIDMLIVPVDENFKKVSTFELNWLSEQFGDNVDVDKMNKEYVAFRTHIYFDETKNEYVLERHSLKEWQKEFDNWESTEISDKKVKFDSIPLFFIDAQRDIQQDIKNHTSFLGKLISKIKIDKHEIKDIEDQLNSLNEKIVNSSMELSHLKQKLKELNETIPTRGKGVEITPFNKKLRDINRGLNINFQDGESESFPLEYYGMGTRSWASLLTFHAYISWLAIKSKEDNDAPYHPVLALEEPEAHLHPNAQRQIYHQLKDIEGQKIISSHSPHIAGQCRIDEMKHFSRFSEETKVNAVDISGLNEEEKRKIDREVMNTRGELLFSRAIVLAEGETEEQALPIFARKYWGKWPFELGLNFIGVGGSGNYEPFLKVAKSFNIKWFIFSDGEPRTKKSVQKQIRAVEEKTFDIENSDEVILLDNGKNFEDYLIEAGYTNELIQAINEVEGDENWFEEYRRRKHGTEGPSKKTDDICPQCKRNIYKTQKRDYSGDEAVSKVLRECLKNGKTRYTPKISEIITGLDGEDKSRRFPPKVKELFDTISAEFNFKIDKDNL
ncbi:MAG: AAA family ATPase [Candidatus Aminicenantes bacterium]|nr:AAA family ATPase [Candidatus Aminicenantes bacterium]